MNENKLHVLFISSWYPNRVRPLLGIFVKRRAIAVAERCNTGAIYICSDEKDGVEETHEDNIYTVRIYYKRVKLKIPLLSQLIKAVRYFSAWRKGLGIYVAKAGKPDIINSNIVFPVSVVAWWLKKRWDTPYIISEHWTGYFPEDGKYKGFFMKMFSRLAVKYASAIVTDAEALKKRMTELGLLNQYYAIPNVVDTGIFNIATDEKQEKGVTFIHVSALDEEQKNVSGIIKSFARVYKEFPDTRLTIVGEGDTLESLVSLSNRLQLKEAIHFAGRKTGHELVDVFHNANAFVLNSNYENLPCVMLEALCCGVPVIGTRVGDVPLWINKLNGILINVHDEQALYDAMVEVIKKRSQYNPAEIRHAVENKVSVDSVSRQLIEVYNKVLNRN